MTRPVIQTETGGMLIHQTWEVRDHAEPGEYGIAVIGEADCFAILRADGWSSSRVNLMAAGPELRRAVCRAEAFIAGFEDDPSQTGVPEILRLLRHAIAKSGGEL